MSDCNWLSAQMGLPLAYDIDTAQSDPGNLRAEDEEEMDGPCDRWGDWPSPAHGNGMGICLPRRTTSEFSFEVAVERKLLVLNHARTGR